MEDYEICLCDHLNKTHEYPIEELLGAISRQYANLAEKAERPAPEPFPIGPDYFIQALSKKEHDALIAFQKKHCESCGNFGHYIYDIAHNGFAAVIRMECPVCGKSEDITDDDCW